MRVWRQVFIRVGGDELPSSSQKSSLSTAQQRWRDASTAAVVEPFLIGQIEASVGVGIGIAVAPSDGHGPGNTGSACRSRTVPRSKAEGRSCIRFFEPDMDAHVEHRIAFESSATRRRRGRDRLFLIISPL